MSRAQPSGSDQLSPENLRAELDAVRRERDDLQQAVEQSRRRALQLRQQNRVLVELSRHAAVARGDVEAAMRLVTEAASRTLGVERVGVWLFNDARTKIRCHDLYRATADEHESGLELTATDYPAYFRALADDRTLAAHDAQTDPRTVEFVDSYLAPLGITSMLDAPVVVGSRMVGIVCHEHVGPPRRWSLEDQAFAGSVTDFVAAAIQARQRLEAEERVIASEGRLAEAQRVGHLGSWEWDLGSGVMWWSNELYRILGVDRADEPTLEGLLAAVYRDDRPEVRQRFKAGAARGEPFLVDFRVERADRSMRFFTAQGRVERDPDGEPRRLFGTAQDITERKRAEILQRSRTRVLERLARNASLERILDILVRGAEELSPRMLCSILLLDRERRLRLGAAPSLPDSYNDAVDGVPIGPSVGSCGTAAYTGRRVVVEDIETDPLWKDFRAAAAAAGLRACWSEPIFSSDGEILGTFAIYYREPRSPAEGDLEVIATSAHLAGIAIERKRSDQRQLLMLRELDHRVKNNLATVLSIAEQTAETAPSLAAFTRAFAGRVRSLAIAHEMLAHTNWAGAELREMADRILGPFGRDGTDRVTMRGEDVVLPPSIAPPLSMVLHELAANAAKYGALSTAEGRLELDWSIGRRETDPNGARRLRLRWSEEDGPPVPPPDRAGFGTELIKHMIAYQLHGESELRFEPTGVQCTIDLPLRESDADVQEWVTT